MSDTQADLHRIITEQHYLTGDGPRLGLATTAELLDELRARIEVDGKLDYRTYDGGKIISYQTS